MGETRWLQQLSAETGRPTAIVAFADLAAPGVEGVLDAYAATPTLRGIRQILNWHADPALRAAAQPDLAGRDRAGAGADRHIARRQRIAEADQGAALPHELVAQTRALEMRVQDLGLMRHKISPAGPHDPCPPRRFYSKTEAGARTPRAVPAFPERSARHQAWVEYRENPHDTLQSSFQEKAPTMHIIIGAMFGLAIICLLMSD